jgi:hypothetical protein
VATRRSVAVRTCHWPPPHLLLRLPPSGGWCCFSLMTVAPPLGRPSYPPTTPLSSWSLLRPPPPGCRGSLPLVGGRVSSTSSISRHPSPRCRPELTALPPLSTMLPPRRRLLRSRPPDAVAPSSGFWISPWCCRFRHLGQGCGPPHSLPPMCGRGDCRLPTSLWAPRHACAAGATVFSTLHGPTLASPPAHPVWRQWFRVTSGPGLAPPQCGNA